MNAHLIDDHQAPPLPAKTTTSTRIGARDLRGTDHSLLGAIVLPLVLTLLTGCFRHQVKDFTPKGGMVCSQVRITGKFYSVGHLDEVTFQSGTGEGIRAEAFFRREPPPSGPLEILATVPEGAVTGPIGVKISTGWGTILGVLGTTHKFDDDFVVDGSPAVPAITSFSASPTTIKEGESTTLSWTVSTPLTRLTFDGISVLGTTSVTKSPTVTHDYTLVAENQCLQRNRTVRVNVIPLPKLTSLSKSTYNPGESVVVNGVGLARSGEASRLQFSQGTTTLPAVTPTSVSATRLTAPVPSSLAAGSVAVRALVGVDTSNPLIFMLDARENGSFQEIKSRINVANATCGTKRLEIFERPAGFAAEYLAAFTQGTTILAQHPFNTDRIGGATFSPDCLNAVSVTHDPAGFAADYLAVVESFATHHKLQYPFSSTDGRWHMLFSPDDTIVIVSAAPAIGPRELHILIHDIKGKRDIASEFIDCPGGCNLQGQVVDGKNVVVTLDGSAVGTYPIFP